MRGMLAELLEELGENDPRGECVLLVGPRTGPEEIDADELNAALDEALSRLRVKDAASEVASVFGLPRREVYQQALARQKETRS